ncbi:helicase-related protein [uncultured Actinomyces sp.]|uniref:helicase-related protein n=1 Tax=uncultured Actinomyces sp. TaxID=249061 RepID=UPI00325FC3EE
MQPDFFDNRARIVKDDLVANIADGDRVAIAASVFSMYAYQELAEQLEGIDELRFVFTSQAFTKQRPAREKREFYIPRLSREQGLCGTDFEIKLRNELTQKAVATECADWIRRKARFRSFEGEGRMSGFMDIDKTDDNVAYMPFDGFTTRKLGCDNSTDAPDVTMRLDASQSRALLKQFDDAWDSGELHDVSEDVLPNEGLGFRESLIWNKLYDFQKDAALAIINKLETYNGCILADSVGLGKTFTALAVIKYYESRNKDVLVLCPKKLRDNWITYNSNVVNNPIAGDRLQYDVLYHTDLSRTRGTSETGLPLDRLNWGAYGLVVIDESHNFRNGGDSASEDRMNRYQLLMEKVIKQGVKTKVLMLSATPVNNRFRDLRNQLALAYWGDPTGWSEKLRLENDIETVFRNAQTVYSRWSKLPAEQRTTHALTDMLDYDFFEVLDQVTVARSRKHIQRYYDMSAIGPFPKRLPPISRRPKLSTLANAINYREIYEELDSLALAVYMPSSYVHPSKMEKYAKMGGGGNLTLGGRETGVRRLMTTNLLKRLESSVCSFRLTLERVLAAMSAALDTIDDYRKGLASGASVADGDLPGGFDFDPDDESGFEVGGATKILVEDMDWMSWERDIEADVAVIEVLISMVRDIDPAHDAKLIELCEQIREKSQSPINPGNRKVLVFTAFSDTADYLYENVSAFAKRELGLECAKVTGDGCACTIKAVPPHMQEVLTCFSPASKERDVVAPQLSGCDVDIVIATDCISEGQNLQDCDYLVNYDIHWNPVRIVQRFGRVDRIGSKNARIHLVNYWPDVELDEYIKLKARVEERMRITVMTSTGDDDYINADETGDLEYRRQQLKQMRDEVVDLEDVSGGVSITDLGLNEFRMDLVGYYRDNPDIDRLPSGINAVVEGDEPGVVFVLRNVNSRIDRDGANHLHPFYVVRMGSDGSVAHGHLEPKAVLDDMRMLCRSKSEPDMALCRAYNHETKNGRDMRRKAGLLRDAVASIVDSKEESDIDSFFAGGTTGFLENDIEGLDDFELVCFLVVRPRC